ncbi:copper resistance protein CopC [Streptomyces sp. NPDC048172]|uniref:copper resistance protein CopC n=1 Tax=Streptomyces sp. NPDC048172 TaxID=3365505 RepID=UPI003723C96E
MPPTTAERSVRRSARIPRALLAVLLGALCALGVVATATPAAAHAALTGSDPAEGAVVDSAPRQVVLTFSEGVAMSDGAIRVLDPHGKRADKGTVKDVGKGGSVKRAAALKSGLPQGTYTVAWQAVSADSHPVAGAFTFSIGKPSKTTAGVPGQSSEAGGGTVGVLYDTGRYAAYAGFVLLVGSAAFVLACWPRAATARSVQRLTVAGWTTLAASTLAMLLLRNPYTGSGELADTFDLGGLKSVVETKPGAALVSRLLLLAAAALFVSVLFGTYAKQREDDDPKASRDLRFGLTLGGAVVAAGLAATWAMAEHASTGMQTALAMPVDVLHLLAVALWLGGLAALLVTLRWGPQPSRAAVDHFSRTALVCVTVLAATGLYQSWRQVGSWNALGSTSYGQLLIVKVGLVALLVSVGWISRRWTRRLADAPRERAQERAQERVTVGAGNEDGREDDGEEAASGDPVRAAQLARQRAATNAAARRKERDADPDRGGLRRSVTAETAIAVVLLAITTVLTSTEPGRTEEQARTAGSGSGSGGSGEQREARSGPVKLTVPFDTGGPKGKGTAKLRISPGRSGDNTLDVRATAPGGKPLDAPEVKVSLTLPAKDVGPLPVKPAPVEGEKGHWRATSVQLPMAGEWKIAVTVRTSDIDQTTETKTARVG